MKAIFTAALTFALLSGTVVFAQTTSTDTNTMGGSTKAHHKRHKGKKTGSMATGDTATTK